MSWYRVISDYQSNEKHQLTVKQGDCVGVLDRDNSTDWWWVESADGDYGYVPVNHLSNEPLTHDEMWDNDEYYDSYGDVKIHREMLNDTVRNKGYQDAVTSAEQYVNGKTVLDVGSGTGILSMICAKYGNAKKVFAVEKSPIASTSRDLIKDNGLADVIEVINADVADVVLPDKVDLLISEWMGTLLLFEFMLESVIIARDKHLKKDGLIWPSSAHLYIVPCQAPVQHKEYIGIWKDVCGFNFSSVATLFDVSARPLHNHILSPEDILSSNAVNILSLNMATVTVNDIEHFKSDVTFSIIKTGTLHGFSSWFDVCFEGYPDPYTPHTLSTSPYQPLTHWKQDLLLLNEPLLVQDGDVINGTVEMNRHKFYRRHLRMELLFTITRANTMIHKIKKEFRVWR